MFVATLDVGPQGLEVDETVRVGPSSGAAEGPLLEIGPARVRGHVARIRFGFGFQGRLDTTVRLACSRCLEPYPLVLGLQFDLIYREPGEAAEGGPDRDDPAVCDLEKGRIPLARLVEEQLYLALPLKPLCRADCPGLCPRCGARQDEGECGCPEEAADPRWEALRGLKERLKN